MVCIDGASNPVSHISLNLYLGSLPKWLSTLCEKLQQMQYFPEAPNQVIVNEYEPGQGISAHIDCLPCFSDTIASLSLGSSCIMGFTHSKTGEKQSQFLEPCSLLVLSGDARYQWQHAIASRKTDKHQGRIIQRTRRISLTFRKVVT